MKILTTESNLNSTTDYDAYFTFALEERSSTYFLIISWLLTHLVGSPLLIGLVNFKNYGSVSYQTLMDKLSAFFYSVCLAYIFTCLNVNFIRAFIKLPRYLCIVKVILAEAYVTMLCLTVLEFSILRYFYVCVWKNIGQLNDDLFGTFFAMLNLLIFSCESTMILMTRGHKGFVVLYCEGKDTEVPMSERRVLVARHNVVVIYFFCIFFCIVQIATYLRIRKITNQLDGATKDYMFDLGKVVESIVILLLFLSMIPGMWVRYMEQQGKLLSVSPLVLVSCDPLPEMAIFVLVPVVTYMRNKSLRKHVKKSMMNFGAVRTLLKFLKKEGIIN